MKLFTVAVASLTLALSLSAADLSQIVNEAAQYESGASAEPLRQIEALVRQSAGNPAQRAELEAALVKLLAPASTYEARRFACAQLAVVGTDASLPVLAEMLKSPDTVGIACLALGSRPSGQANELLRKTLASATGPVREQIIVTLGDRQDGLATKLLTGIARGDDSRAALAAIVALGKIANAEAMAELAALRQRGGPDQARAAVQASLVAADQAVQKNDRATGNAIYLELLIASQPEYVRRAAFESLLRLDADQGERRVFDTLRGIDAALKPSAIARVPALTSAGISEKVAREIAHLAPAEQVLVIQALAARNDAGARAAIQDQLNATDQTVRLAAISALGRVGDASAVPALARILVAYPGPDEPKSVELSLASLQGGDAVDQALMAHVASRTAEPKAPILAALVRRARPVSVRIFVAQSANPDPAMAKLAFQGLSRVAKAEDVPMLLKALSGLRAEAARAEAEAFIGQALSRSSEPARNSAAVRKALAGAKTVEARCSLLRLLALCPESAALAEVKSALADSNAQVKDAAIRTLADWPTAAAWDALVGVYRQAASEAERMVALRGLARLLGEQNAKPDTELIARYRDLFATGRSDNDRKLVLGALSGCGHPDALQLAVSLLANPGVRAEAEAAVKRIAEAIKTQYPQAAEAALKQLR